MVTDEPSETQPPVDETVSSILLNFYNQTVTKNEKYFRMDRRLKPVQERRYGNFEFLLKKSLYVNNVFFVKPPTVEPTEDPTPPGKYEHFSLVEILRIININ